MIDGCETAGEGLSDRKSPFPHHCFLYPHRAILIGCSDDIEPQDSTLCSCGLLLGPSSWRNRDSRDPNGVVSVWFAAQPKQNSFNVLAASGSESGNPDSDDVLGCRLGTLYTIHQSLLPVESFGTAWEHQCCITGALW